MLGALDGCRAGLWPVEAAQRSPHTAGRRTQLIEAQSEPQAVLSHVGVTQCYMAACHGDNRSPPLDSPAAAVPLTRVMPRLLRGMEVVGRREWEV